jgi:RNA polymerase sigma-70 factor (ECF subfamily)
MVLPRSGPLAASPPAPAVAGDGASGRDDGWLDEFHRGTRAAIERCYRDHFATVERAVAGLLSGGDRETVIHEVFSRLLAREELRRSFRGGALGAWLTVVARNQAIDYRRRLNRETGPVDTQPTGDTSSWQDAADARLLIERFRGECLSPDWFDVFDLCFLRQLSQREAAKELGLSRTTVAYREMRIRRRLRHFLLGGDSP